MTVNIPRGGNTSLQSELAAESYRLSVQLSCNNGTADAIVFLLKEDGKVTGDEGMVFYNNKTAHQGAIAMSGADAFTIELNKLPVEIERLCFCLSVDKPAQLSKLSPLSLVVRGGVSGRILAACEFDVSSNPEAALILGEVYTKDGEWKVKSIGQGFAQGLEALAEKYGIVVAEASQAAGASSAPKPAPSQAGSPGHVFEKPPQGYPEILVNLTWNPVAVEPERKGFLGGLLKVKPRGLDLDLCCLFELSDGYRGVVQALGDSFGAYNAAPFVELMGDERKGAGAAQGETLRINGPRWDEIKRIVIYAMIFEGPPNWAYAGGKAVIKMPDLVPVTVKLNLNESDKRACTIAVLENIDGNLVVHKRVEAFKNPRELDMNYGWGLRWGAGTKD